MTVLVEVLDVLHAVGLLHVDVSLKLHAEEGKMSEVVTWKTKPLLMMVTVLPQSSGAAPSSSR